MNAQPLKLVFAGPVGAGKTTAIAAIADAPPVSTDTPMSEGPMGDKTTTTVAFDFATLKTEEGDPVFLYGLPGQERFDFMRRIILNGALGVVLALNGANTDIAVQCTQWLSSIQAIAPGMTVVVGITHTDERPDFDMNAVRDAATAVMGSPTPVLTFDARSQEQTSHLVRTLLVMLEP